MRWRVVGSLYVTAVGALAGLGFATSTSWPILLAGAAALPSSLVALPAFYLAYGFLTLVPGATTTHSSGAGSCTAGGTCHAWSTGDPAPWLNQADGVLGVLALAGAAALNVLALELIITRRRKRRDEAAPPSAHRPTAEHP